MCCGWVEWLTRAGEGAARAFAYLPAADRFAMAVMAEKYVRPPRMPLTTVGENVIEDRHAGVPPSSTPARGAACGAVSNATDHRGYA